MLTLLFSVQLCYGQNFKETTEDSLSLAESYLGKLSEIKAKQRKAGGATALGIGGAFLVGGIVLVSNSGDNDFLSINESLGKLYIASGVFSGILGVVQLSTLSKAEKKYRNLWTISGRVQRDNAARQALSGFAKAGETRRMISSLISGGIAIFHLTQQNQNDILSATLFAGGSVFGLITKSKEEKIYERYEQETENKQTIAKVGLQFSPSGRGIVKAKINF